MLETNEPLWDQQKSADVGEIRVTFALAEFLKYQATNGEETVSMLDMAQNILESYKQSKTKILRRVLSRYMRTEQQNLLYSLRAKFDLW
jgi:flagellar biosynthesis/type III secretory pathway ATPase